MRGRARRREERKEKRKESETKMRKGRSKIGRGRKGTIQKESDNFGPIFIFFHHKIS
jgi:hypothetical protein